MLYIILTCLALIACVVSVVRGSMKEAFDNILPPVHPGALPFIGHAHHLIADTKFAWLLVQKIADNCRRLGGIICGKIGTDLYYVITDPDDALTVANTCLQKHYLYSFAKDWLGQGLITGSGEVYKRHRKMLNPCYTASFVHGFLDVFNSQARKLVGQIDDYCTKESFDPSPLIRNTTLETSCLATFGSDITNKNFLQNYMNATDDILHMITQRFQKFYLHNDLCYKLLGYHKKQSMLIKTVHRMSNEIIQQRKAALKYENIGIKSDFVSNQEIQFKSFLDHLIELSMEGSLTDDEIREEADTNIAAAFETTSYTLLHIIILLGTYPNVQEKLYTELVKILGEDRDVDKDDLQQLVYTKSVIKESLRVIPSVPVVLRYIDKEVELKNYTMRADSQCAIMTVGMHRTAAWGPDVDDFKPERWLDPSTVPANGKHFGGFGVGKRACAGMTYAMIMMTVTLAHLVRQYKWTADVTKLELKIDVTLRPSSEQEINIQRRRKNIFSY